MATEVNCTCGATGLNAHRFGCPVAVRAGLRLAELNRKADDMGIGYGVTVRLNAMRCEACGHRLDDMGGCDSCAADLEAFGWSDDPDDGGRR